VRRSAKTQPCLARRLRRGLRIAEADDPVYGVLVLSDDFGNRVELLAGLRSMDPEIYSRSFEVKFRSEIRELSALGVRRKAQS
jgi:hypothetical protein